MMHAPRMMPADVSGKLYRACRAALADLRRWQDASQWDEQDVAAINRLENAIADAEKSLADTPIHDVELIAVRHAEHAYVQIVAMTDANGG